ncbi:hypothetical protein D3C71_385580 [compost metagenome]
MTGHALVDQLVIGLDRVLQLDAASAQFLDRLVDIVGRHRQVLDALAVVLANELLDLGLVVLALVQGDADGAVGRDHGLGEEAGRLTLDVEILLFLEAEDLVVEGRPGAHLTALHVVGQVVENIEADGVGRLGFAPALDLGPAVIERALLTILVHQIEVRAADALQHLGLSIQRADRGVYGLGAARQGQVIGLCSVGDPEGHARGRGAVSGAEVGGLSGRFVIDQQVGLALLVAGDLLGRMGVGGDEAQLLDQTLHGGRIGAGELDELEAVEADGVFGGDGHVELP